MKIRVKTLAHYSEEPDNAPNTTDVPTPDIQPEHLPFEEQKPIGITFHDIKTDEPEGADAKGDVNQDSYNQINKKTFREHVWDLTHNNSIPWRNYFLYIILLTSLSFGMTFSKYYSLVSLGGSVTSAKFQVDITETQEATQTAVPSEFTFSRIDQYTVINYHIVNNSEVVVVVKMNVEKLNGTRFDFTVDNSQTMGLVKEPFELGAGDSKDVKLYVYSSGAQDIAVLDNLLVTFDYEQK